MTVDPDDVSLEVLLGRDYRDRMAESGAFDRLPAPASVEVVYAFHEELSHV